jgi:hypothetical protein
MMKIDENKEIHNQENEQIDRSEAKDAIYGAIAKLNYLGLDSEQQQLDAYYGRPIANLSEGAFYIMDDIIRQLGLVKSYFTQSRDKHELSDEGLKPPF